MTKTVYNRDEETTTMHFRRDEIELLVTQWIRRNVDDFESLIEPTFAWSTSPVSQNPFLEVSVVTINDDSKGVTEYEL